MRKKAWVAGMVLMLTTLLALSDVSQAAMWVGAQLGGNFSVASNRIEVDGINRGRAYFGPAVIGGATIGYDFVNTGFGAYAWPEWMKYFSVATDITYNRLSLDSDSGPGSFSKIFAPGSTMDGSVVAWTFLLMAHYGFFPDSEVPTGRVNPYIGIGPAILWSSINSFETRVGSLGGGRATNVALVVEPGIRWMVLPKVSIDTALRYRYAVPTWDVANTSIKINPLNMLAFLIRANYHF
jgi:hypothetical protein